MEMTGQALVAGVAVVAFGCLLLGYGMGWRQCATWRDNLDSMPSDDDVVNGAVPGERTP
jgi:hypothetical protein